MRQLADLGLQLERTALAWRRTALSVAGAALAGARLVTVTSAPWAVGIATGGLVVAAGLSGLAGHRYAHSATILRRRATGGPIHLPGGGILTALAALQMLGGLLALAVLLA